jgi:ribosome-associated toxin RatA of RatAB toxin-antitoxin module
MPSENIRVDAWNGSAWNSVFATLSSGWNNASVSAYLMSPIFTIRFKGTNETSDTVQNSWNIDAALLHVWYNEYTAEVELMGSSNTEGWSQVNWTIDSAWTAGSVNVTLQLYNYTLGGYSTSGNGYMAYTSDSTPNTDEDKNQTISAYSAQFRNATGHWRMKIKGVKATDVEFDLKVDWAEYKIAETAITRFTFKNRGSVTTHLVSLWIVNSTVHKHYNVNIFLSSGETLSYDDANVTLPNGEYIAKVVTRRGNTAVYTSP